MKKTTKEYAEKLAIAEFKKTNHTPSTRFAYYDGAVSFYLKAIEENAVPELIEALEKLTEYVVRELTVVHELPQDQIDYITREAKAALKKAKS